VIVANTTGFCPMTSEIPQRSNSALEPNFCKKLGSLQNVHPVIETESLAYHLHRF